MYFGNRSLPHFCEKSVGLCKDAGPAASSEAKVKDDRLAALGFFQKWGIRPVKMHMCASLYMTSAYSGDYHYPVYFTY